MLPAGHGWIQIGARPRRCSPGACLFQSLRIQRSVGRAKDGTTFPLSLKLKAQPRSQEAADGVAAPGGGYRASVWVFSTISGLITLLPDGTICGINHNFALMLFGYGKAELLGKVRRGAGEGPSLPAPASPDPVGGGSPEPGCLVLPQGREGLSPRARASASGLRSRACPHLLRLSWACCESGLEEGVSVTVFLGLGRALRAGEPLRQPEGGPLGWSQQASWVPGRGPAGRRG